VDPASIPPGCAASVRACRINIGARDHDPVGPWLPVLAMRFHAPRSFTGQDVLELLVPAQPHLVQRILARITSVPGTRLAGPGEFSARAYRHGKLSLEQAEGLAASISAEHAGQLSAARRLMEGRTGERYRAWRDELVTLLALVEAGIDFSDQQDVVAIEPSALIARAEHVIAQIRDAIGTGHGATPAHATPPRVVLAGAPNAGKSTLLNALLGRARAVVSPVAGTTRDVLEETLDLSRWSPAAGKILLCDTAGLDCHARNATRVVPIASSMRTATHEAIASATLIVHCDPLGRFDPGELDAPEGVPVLRARTKGDRPIPASQPGMDRDAIAVCALDGWNLGALARAIAQGVFGSPAGEDLVLARHRAALARSVEALGRVARASRSSAGDEIVAQELRAAIDGLGELTGRVHPDEVIGRVFATFCVGK
jgi:tRNA modification GTPase